MAFSYFNGSRPEELFTYTNEIVEGALGWGILLLIFIVAYTYLLNNEVKKAFAGASFLTSILGAILWFMDILQPWAIFMMGFILMLSVAYLRAGAKD